MKRTLLSCLGCLMLMSSHVTAQLQSVVASNTAFGLNLYGQLATNSGNLFFSPYSISTCLAMLYAGASAETKQQMSQVLGFGTNQTEFASMFGDLQRQLLAARETNSIALNIANALWTQEGYPFLPAFLDTATNEYQASVNQADFVTSAAAVTQTINSWVSQETQGKIQNLVPPGSLTPLTRLVLANAIYFKGTWSVAFEQSNTVTQPFFLANGSQVTAPLMHQPPLDSLKFNYLSTNGFQALELPYGSNQLSMVILLPSSIDGYRSLEQRLSPPLIETVLAQMQKQPVELFLPKFTLESSFDLKSTLAQMGMPDAFAADQADFSGIDGMKDLFISFIFHKAWGEVNEQGTEAAAATAGGVTATVVGIGYPLFRADRPFLFFIRDTQTGSLLFLGRLLDPSQSAVATPQLHVGLESTGKVAISWPVTTPSCVLQENSSLTTTQWTVTTNAPTVVGQQIQVILPRSSANKFYRLLQTDH